MAGGRSESQDAKRGTENLQLMTDSSLTTTALTTTASHRHGHAFHDFLDQLFCLLGFLQSGGVASIHRHAVGKHGPHKRFEILRNAEIPAVQEGHRLPGAVEHL